jgi:hypothetical protein
MGIIKIYHDKKWTLQFLDALYNSIDNYYSVFFAVRVAKFAVRGYENCGPQLFPWKLYFELAKVTDRNF